MRRIVPAIVVTCTLSFLVSARDAQGGRSGVWTEDRVAAPATGLVRLQADFFVVSGSEEKLAELDATEKPAAESAATLMESLGAFGRAELIGRIDEVVDLASEVKFESGSRVPVRVPGSDQRRRPGSVSITYESIGCQGTLRGDWEDESDPPTARVDAAFKVSWIVPSDTGPRTAEERDEAMPPKMVWGAAEFEEEVELTHGRAAVLVAEPRRLRLMTMGQDVESDMRFVVRLALTRMDSALGDARAEREKAPKQDQTFINVEIYEVTGSRDEIIRLRPEELIPPEVEGEDVVKRLAEFGEVNVLSRPNMIVAWPQTAQFSIGERVPMTDSAPGQTEEEAAEAVRYEEVGINLTLDGQWLDEVDEKLARMRCRFESSSLQTSQRRGADGRTTATPRIVRTDRRYRGDVWEGEWTWLPRQTQTSSQDRQKLTCRLTRMRIQRVRAEGAGATSRSEDDEPKYAPPKPPIGLKVAVYEVRGDAKSIRDLDVKLLERNTPPGEFLDALGRFGVAKRWMESVESLVWPESTKVSAEGPEEEKISIDLQGRRLDESPPASVMLNVDVRHAWSVPSKQWGDIATIKEQREDRVRRSLVLERGRPVWLSSHDLAWQDARAESEELRQFLVRLEAVASEPGEDEATETAIRPQAARLETELIDFEAPMDAIARLDFGDLTRRMRTAEQLIEELKKIGKVERKRRLVTTVDDLREELSITSGARVPTGQDVTVSASGRVTPSISYRSMGTILDLYGRWLTGHKSPTALLNVAIDDSGAVDSPIAISPDFRLQSFTKMKHEQAVRAASGRLVILASSDVAATGDDDRVRLGLAVITATRLGGGGGDIESDRQERARTALAVMNAAQCARVRLDAFEVPVTMDALAELDTTSLTTAGSTEALLGRLQKLGPARLRYCVDRPIVLTEPDHLTRGARVPTVMDVRRGRAGRAPTPSVTYEEIGYILELAGRWREDAPDIADLALRFEYSGIGETAIRPAGGIALPSFAQHEINHHLAVRAGEPAILVTTDLPVPGDEETPSRLFVCRLVLSHDEG